jgi:hypothetical protein
MFLPFLYALAAPGPDIPALPAWMSGCWESEAGGLWTEECWSEPRGKMMIGHSRTGSGERAHQWESMQLLLEDETDDPAVVRLAFWAAPQGVNRTMFAWAASKQPGLTFYNLENDYPQRIRYWRDGEALMAEIALADGSKARRWRYRAIRR